MNNSVIGIVAVKEQSKRFPFKNFVKINGKELFLTNVEAIINAGYECVVAVNSHRAKAICDNNFIDTIYRGINISESEQALFEVIKWAYQSISNEYGIIVYALANIINLESSDIQKAVNLLIEHNLKEVRSYDENGVENGLIVLRSEYLLKKHEVSEYVGAITTNSKEIHYEYELKE